MIESIPYVLTGIGIIVSILYYASVLRNQNKTQQMQLETRNAQFFIQFAKELNTPGKSSNWAKLARYEWKDLEDFERKYGSVDNPEAFGMRWSYWASLNDLGWLVEKGMVDISDVNALAGQLTAWTWEKFKPIIYDHRAVYNLPDYLIYWERLIERLIEYRKKENLYKETPEHLDDYLSTLK